MADTQLAAVPNLPLCRAVTLAHLTEVLPPATLQAALADAHLPPTRIKRLDWLCTLLLLSAMHLCPRQRLGDVLRTLMQTVRLRRPSLVAAPVPGDSAITQRRAALGLRPVVALFQALAGPQATPQTRGAFLGAYRLAALDGTTFALPDTPENRRAFGGPSNQHGDTAWPQVRAVVLLECGTHAVRDAGCWPYATSEHPCARRLLRSVTPAMLVLTDRGLHSYAFCAGVQARGAHFLGRLPANVQLPAGTPLPAGSVLTVLTPGDRGGQRHQPARPVRLITYVVDDPHAAGTVYRLLTDVLDHAAYPAHLLAVAYHERWEIENALDELKTHLDLAGRPFRSLRPWGVRQEFYGLLIAHSVVRALMHASAREADLDPDRLSVTHAVRVLQRYLPECQRATPAALPLLAACLRAELREQLLPPRRDRWNPRAVKQRRSRFPPKAPHVRGSPRASIRETLRLI